MHQKTALVVSAHSADFVWRAGGAIAAHAKLGYDVTVVCLSFGERGESAKLWRKPGMTLEAVKADRKREAENAAKALGVHDIQFYDLGDYPLQITPDAFDRLVDLYRGIRPEFVLTHSRQDPYNFDHPMATEFAQHARVIAQAHGHRPEVPVLGAPPVYLFEPHQPEQCNWTPSFLLDITGVWEQKLAAIQCMEGQEHLWEYYTRVALQRGVQASRNSDYKIIYGEGYEAVFPHVTGTLGHGALA
ncbi:PIG-L deacetylase family protein [Rhizobium sp. CECT 9324]|uniref:PIG-L deacetylase family protein n=1 Tax=Rhizobium sp. CECT 9324 TaxID=2845820 RepID=UPI001E5FFD1C|nr:PIG-L deacetylase family protein [Rhizobium sp. CECT 9324]CAH0343282.1 4-oxalmesaconate hydratase [Rhizobium sp. CECT 9324]